ncbi:RidA family protein [Aureimonas fodinaquatilis]|uniref:RidA family protein n=1 Tax=Aureimonas fodinaquatilis TaxID=2565783 RepID=A0A5B0DS47_9HYPH|nr:RidA family protein [Aureimonas fodinaquatilis]KAA0969627.1 RidA family protein [Aureimonas fodinaquatilis]
MLTRHHTSHRLSRCVEYSLSGTMVVTAGEVADDLSADIIGQTRDVLTKIDGLLADAGTDKNNLVAAYIWLPSISDFDAMNAVWDKWLPEGKAPVRACVEARLANPAIRVEIQVYALKP